MARFSRTYFNTAAILLGAISSGYAYAQSPYTNLCSCDGLECPGVTDTSQSFTDVTLLNGEKLDTVEASNEQFYFCNQDEIGFPPVPAKQDSNNWMTDEQEKLTRIYGWTCFWLLILYCVFILGGRTIFTALSIVKGVYKVSSVRSMMLNIASLIFTHLLFDLLPHDICNIISQEESTSIKILVVGLGLRRLATFQC